MEFYFGFEMRKYSLYSVTGIDDGILQCWMVLFECLDEIQTYKELVSTPDERIVCKMKSGMNIFVFQCFNIQFLLPEVFIVFLSEFRELPKKGGSICTYHAMCDLLESFVGFYSWIFEKIPIYGSYLVCLAELYWYAMIVFVYSSIYSIPSIDHGKVRSWIPSTREIL